MKQFLVMISLTLIVPAARAGLWDRVKDNTVHRVHPRAAVSVVKAKVAACAEHLSVKGAAALSAVSSRSQQIRGLRPLARRQLQNIVGNMSPLYAQLCEIGAVGKDCGRASVKTVAVEAGPMIARVVGFEGRLEDLKDGMILPLISRVRAVREARDQRASAQDLTRRLTSLAFFTVEIGFKLPRFLPMAAQGALAGAVGGVSIGLTNDVPSWGPTIATQFAPAEGAALTGTDLSRMLIGEVVANIKRALTQPDLTLTQRLGEIVSMEAALLEWFKSVGATVGWGDVESELASWRRKQALLLLTDQSSPTTELLEAQPEALEATDPADEALPAAAPMITKSL